MKKILLATAAICLLAVSCKKNEVTPAEDNNVEINDSAVVVPETPPEESVGEKTVGTTCNNGYQINVHWTKNPSQDSITVDVVKDGKSEIFKMGQTMAASGAKFQSKDGHYLWNKGKGYLFGMGEDLVCECQEK